ncbi:unnamed protein product [Effrenium voratum]|uniref:Uncharacterized protein n=1 Tax=Effrenium voratum TaxID=2562239 RepID=A0AA36HKJ7_9DINO|nr:unnamed protein product [Effrenium voratum]
MDCTYYVEVEECAECQTSSHSTMEVWYPWRLSHAFAQAIYDRIDAAWRSRQTLLRSTSEAEESGAWALEWFDDFEGDHLDTSSWEVVTSASNFFIPLPRA